MPVARRGLLVSALGAGVAFGNMAVALPLLVLALGRSPALAGVLVALDTVAFSLGALLPLPFRRAAAPVAVALALLGCADVLFALPLGIWATALAALLHGTAMGLFWVGVQSSLGRRSGVAGSERAFVHQYALYVAGTASGGTVTGAIVAVLRASGVGHVPSIRATFLLGAAAVLAALPAALAWLRTHAPAARTRFVAPALRYGLRLQVPDLFLVSAMGTLLGLSPVILRDSFGLSPLTIGLIAAAVAAGKISGSLTASRIASTQGRTRTIGSMLGAAAFAAALLLGAQAAWLYGALMVAVTFLGIGVWPTLVDGALARVAPEQRRTLSVAWNVREYLAIALTTVVAGQLLHDGRRPVLALALVAVLLAAAAVTSLGALRAPVFVPETE